MLRFLFIGSWFSSVPPGECRHSTLNKAMAASYQILSHSSSFIYRHIIDVIQSSAAFLNLLPWRNPWNSFQVSGNFCIKIIISTAHGTLAWSVSCRYNNTIIIVKALSREWYFFSVDLFILANKFKKRCFFFQSRSLAEPRMRNPGLVTEKAS
jgi:hypothetical protein